MATDNEMNAYARWAALVAGMISARNDLRTLAWWAPHVGASTSTIRARCRAADVPVLASRDLGRLLRLVARSNFEKRHWDPAAELQSLDPRPLKRLLLRGGLTEWPVAAVPPSIEWFLERQSLVHERALTSLHRAIAGRCPHELLNFATDRLPVPLVESCSTQSA